FDNAGLAKTLTKPAQTVRHRIRQSCIEESDHRHLLLRAGREWGRNRRAAEQRDELASFHCPMPPVLRTERITHLGTWATSGYVTRSSATPSVKPIASVAGVPVAVRRSRSCQTLVSYGVTAAVDAARCGVACSVGYVAAGGRRPRRALGFSAAKRERHRTQYCGPTDNPKHNELFHSVLHLDNRASCYLRPSFLLAMSGHAGPIQMDLGVTPVVQRISSAQAAPLATGRRASPAHFSVTHPP